MSVLHRGRDDSRLRATTWRGDPAVAQIVTRGPVTEAEVVTALDDLRRRGCATVLTAALPPAEQSPFLALGFHEHERLHLLRRGVEPIRPRRSVEPRLRRFRRPDLPAVLGVDHLAFPTFWRFDGAAIDDAVAATPAARFRVVVAPGADEPVGYAITGRSGSRGYLQRLAVHPARRRAGLATELIDDGLRWLRRWGGREVLVNTQESNAGALALYEAVGFDRQPHGLAVLRLDLSAAER